MADYCRRCGFVVCECLEKPVAGHPVCARCAQPSVATHDRPVAAIGDRTLHHDCLRAEWLKDDQAKRQRELEKMGIAAKDGLPVSRRK